MAIQQDAQLQEPLPLDSPPVLEFKTMTPELATAALNLIIDSRVNLQSQLNKTIIWSFPTWSFILALFAPFAAWNLQDYFAHNSWDYLKGNHAFRGDIIQSFIALVMLGSVVFTGLCLSTYWLREEATKLAEKTTDTFGFDLAQFARLPSNPKTTNDISLLETWMKPAKNTQLVIYRGVPICVVVLKLNKDLTSKDQFVVDIQQAAVRRVYVKSGIFKDLLEFAFKRSAEMLKEFKVETPKMYGKEVKIKLMYNCYSFETEPKKVLQENHFECIVKTGSKSPFITAVFGCKKETWCASLKASHIET